MDRALTKYGAIVFDDPSIHEGGWACIDGGTPYRIRGTIDIPDDHILWCNVEPEVMRRDGLSARFRGSDWGPLRIGEPRSQDHWDFKSCILSEYGISEVSAQRRAAYLAKIFGRLMQFTRAFYPSATEPLKFGLAHTLRARRPKDIAGEMTSPVRMALEMAKTFGCAAERPPGVERFRRVGSLYPPRYDHAMQLLSQPIPANGCRWNRLRKHEIPTDSSDIAEWVESRKPMLVQMVVESLDNPVAHQLLNPAGETIPGMGRRLWRTGEEAIAFSAFGRVRINNAFEADASVIPIDTLPQSIREIDPVLVRSSPTLSLFFLALQKSFMLSDVHFADKKLGYKTTPSEVFMRARDMLLCAQWSMALHQAGFGVIWYGSSSVQISIPDDFLEAKKTLFNAAAQCGMMTAAGTMPQGGRDILSANSQDDNGLLRYVLLEGEVDKIFDLDDTMFENIMDRLRAGMELS